MPHHVLPAPQALTLTGAPSAVTAGTLETLTAALRSWAPRAAGRLERVTTDLEARGVLAPSGPDAPRLSARLDPALPAEHYALDLRPETWELTAGDEAGAFWAVQTLAQVVAGGSVPEVVCQDGPAYPVRGFMLDLARHFLAVPDVERLIDLAATYRFNRLHLHLSDDQGWRVEIDGRPRLTSHASATAVGGGDGGFLTFADYEHLQQYAYDRHLELVPEVDLPGHTHAAQVAYPGISPDGAEREPYTGIEVGFSHVHLTSPATWDFVEDVVASLAARTRGRYLHLGGDEAHTLERDEYVAFVERLGEVVDRHGKLLVMWQEAAGARLPAGTQIQYWTREVAGDHLGDVARTQGVQFVASPGHHAYLDQKYHPGYPLGLEWAAHVELRDAYDWDPADALPGVPAEAIAGVEACLWSETVRTLDDVTTLVLPRLVALAEVAWGSPRDWPRFAEAVAVHGRSWDADGLAFHRSPQIDWT